jgi:hypothetical protein
LDFKNILRSSLIFTDKNNQNILKEFISKELKKFSKHFILNDIEILLKLNKNDFK